MNSPDRRSGGSGSTGGGSGTRSGRRRAPRWSARTRCTAGSTGTRCRRAGRRCRPARTPRSWRRRGSRQAASRRRRPARRCAPDASPIAAAPGRGAGRGPVGAGPGAGARWPHPARPARSRTPAARPATWPAPRRPRTAPAALPASHPCRPGPTRTPHRRRPGHPQPGHIDQDPPRVRQRLRHRPADQPGGPLRQLPRHREHPRIRPATNLPHGKTGRIRRHLLAPHLDGDIQGQRYRVPAPQTCSNGGPHMKPEPWHAARVAGVPDAMRWPAMRALTPGLPAV